MPFSDAIRVLNGLKRRRIIRDYALIGAVAATAYMEPVFTEDLDVIVLVSTDDEYLRVFQRVADYADGVEGMHYILGGTPVQMFPTTVKPLFRDTLEQARRARVGNLRVKVATPEHLIALYLEAFRARDRLRIPHLMTAADKGRLEALLRRFDETGELTRRLQTLL
ncbi:MAG: hypothetical protein QF659_02015 [Dehalococcoidia bacterium]|jgi:hypothetical protein|nr:hypothetical protein [Dehalococcoidia bacterium]